MSAIARTLQELDRLADPLDQHADPVHLTASAVVVGPRGTLLHRHKRLGLWLQPGGHIDAGEHPADAALREVREETGVAAWHDSSTRGLVHLDVHAGGRGHTHLDLRYLLQAGTDDPRPGPGESPDVRWFDWDEALAVADAGLAGLLRALRPR
jgi:8-oxo-dGTP pyrophosphatase MutT (NUDIX family)